MVRRCVANKNHVARLKVKVTLCIGFNETCSCPANNFVMCGEILKNKLADFKLHSKTSVVREDHVASLKVKIII